MNYSTETIKEDLNCWLNEYLTDVGGDITPLQFINLDQTMFQLAQIIKEIIDQNKNLT